MSNQGRNNLSLLFERPLEPTFFPKSNGKKIIDIPVEFRTERYQNVILERNAVAEYVAVKDIVIPDISFLDGIKKNEAFSLFLEKHQQISTKLTQLFLDQPDVETFFATAVYCRDRTNVFLFQYSLSVAVQHRADTKDIDIPSAVALFPDQFIDPTVMNRFMEEGKLRENERVSAF